MLSLFRKPSHTAVLEPGGARIVVRRGERLLSAALAAGLDWPYDCRVGSCGSCRCVLKSGRIKALTDFVYTLDAADVRAGAILACQTELKSDVVVDVVLGDARSALDTVSGAIAGATALTHDILEVVIHTARPAFVGARAGQYAELSVAGLPPRSYSFARRPAHEPGGALRFYIRHIPGGAFTDWLFGADRVGSRVTLSGPHGAFYLRPGTGHLWCMAGGSGLAPIEALIEDGVAQGLERDCTVIFGARTQRDLYRLDELALLGRRWQGTFDLVPILSEEPLDSAWTGARGLATAALSHLTAGVGPDDQGYLCGPPPMVDACIVALEALGLPRNAIFYDRFVDASTQPGGSAASGSNAERSP